MNKNMHLSIIIPAHNEAERMGATLSEIYDFLSTKDYDYEIIIVDDGSADETVSNAKKSQLFKEYKLGVIKNWVNMGKGFSVKRGILAARGDYILFTDADLSTPIKELNNLFDCMEEGYDIVIGSRGVKESIIKIHQPWYRERMGRIFNFFVKLLLMKEFSDTQCGFKLFKGSIARNIAQFLKIDGFCFDVEMLYLAKQKLHKVKELGIVWDNSPNSKVKMIDSSLHMFLDLFKIKVLHK